MKKKVLLIEDDKIVRENTTEILELAAYEVKTAENGKIGVELASTFLPDVIICDILMPVLDGFGVLQIISRNPDLEQIPFIFLTAKTHHDDLRKGMELGADDYLSKPFEESELLRAIDSRLKRVEAFDNKKQDVQSLKGVKSGKFRTIKNIDQFLEKKRLFKYKKGETIYCIGNQSNHLFLIKKGIVKTFKNNEQGKELITGFYKEDEYFGYTSFAKHLPHHENSEAFTATELYKISKNEITSIINNNHHIIYSFIDLLVSNLMEANELLLLLAYGSVRKKTAQTLLRLLKTYPLIQEKELIINRINLANTIGIAKETLTRTLHDFKEEKLIEVSSKGVTVLNIEGLSKIY